MYGWINAYQKSVKIREYFHIKSFYLNFKYITKKKKIHRLNHLTQNLGVNS